MYQCNDCGAEFTAEEADDRDDPQCPECESEDVESDSE